MTIKIETYKNRPSEMKLFWCQEVFFSEILILKMDVKMNLRIITKNHAADPEKGFPAKSISKSNGYATAMPTAWVLIIYRSILQPFRYLGDTIPGKQWPNCNNCHQETPKLLERGKNLETW